MRAILKTRCGCTRDIEVPFPPPRGWRVPMYRPLPGWSSWKMHPEPIEATTYIDIRAFELREHSGGPNGVAFYEEQA